ncbi:hypothetical protein J6Z48_03225 [bacterium]|nr:hypothetical protein [bacterium]
MLRYLSDIFGTILEPFALCLLLVIFTIPVATVINLEPITKNGKTVDVLGVSTSNEVTISLIDGKHSIFKNEELESTENNQLKYSTDIKRREAGVYSKPILEINNDTDQDRVVEITTNPDIKTSSNISILIGEDSYTLIDKDGATSQKINIDAGESYTLFLSIENDVNIQFSENLEIYLEQK